MAKTGLYFEEGKSDHNPLGWINYEVLYPNMFTSDHPYGPLSRKEAVPDLKIPIYKLSHITHSDQAESIASSQKDNYSFVPHQKLGKHYKLDGTPIGESYVYDSGTKRFNYVAKSSSKPLLPQGYYTWLGISTVDWLKNDTKKVRKVKQNTHMFESTIANYLKDPPHSCYGTTEFSTPLPYILQSYKTSRKCRDVYLKLTGTLRYKKEICYVITVCSSMDAAIKDSQYDLNAMSVFISNGLIDDSGKVIDRKRAPHFCPEYVDTSYSWEQLAFAFYFPSKGSTFECPKSTIQQGTIKHDPSSCLYKQPRGKGKPQACPDQPEEQASSDSDDEPYVMSRTEKYYS